MSIIILKSNDVKNFLIKTVNILYQFPSFIENIQSNEIYTLDCFPDLNETKRKLIYDIVEEVDNEEDVEKYTEIYIKTHIMAKFKILDFSMKGNHYFYDYINKYFNFNFNDYDIYISHIVYTIRQLSREDMFYPYMDMIIFIADKWNKEDIDKNLITDICQITNKNTNKNRKGSKNNYIRLFMRCIESLHEWIIGKGGNPKRQNLDDTCGDILEMLDHDWLKISSHGILFMSGSYSIFSSDDDFFDKDFFDYMKQS